MDLRQIKKMFVIGSVWCLKVDGHYPCNTTGTVIATKPNLVISTTEHPQGRTLAWPKATAIVKAVDGRLIFKCPPRIALTGIGPVTLTRQEERTIYLVSCVSKKAATPAPARNFYQSPWFKKVMAYCADRNGETFILSAAHGLVPLDSIVEPYDLTLNDKSIREVRNWTHAVIRQIKSAAPEKGTRFVILAGDRYRKFLVPGLQAEGYETEVPMQGLGIGEQLAYLTKARAAA